MTFGVLTYTGSGGAAAHRLPAPSRDPTVLPRRIWLQCIRRGTMAAADDMQSLRDEATCSVCLEYFTNPVSVECGHTFCLSCISKCWEGMHMQFHCPQCRATFRTRTVRPNRQLANVVEIAKKLQMSSKSIHKDILCPEHKETLKLFCEVDQRPICIVCRESYDHKPHTVLPVKEAAQEFKYKFQSYIEPMKRKVEYFHGLQSKEEKKATKVMDKFKSERDRISSEFENLHQFLEKVKKRYLTSLEVEEDEILQTIRMDVTKLQEQQAALHNQIAEIEWKCKQPDIDLLRDLKSTLSRFEHMKVQHADSESSEEEETEEDGTQADDTEEEDGEDEEEEEEEEEEEVEEVEELEEDKEYVPSFCKQQLDLQREIIESLEWRWASSNFIVTVTMDEDTASHRLAVSEGGKRVRCTGTWQNLQDNPKRFTGLFPCVLGTVGYSTGRYYWEVELLHQPGWCVGVARESVSRKQRITQCPENGIWAVSLGYNGLYTALTTPPTSLSLRQQPVKLGVYLDYDAGRLSVYNVATMDCLYTFTSAAFSDMVYPYFSLWHQTEMLLK